MVPEINVLNVEEWYSIQTNRWSYRLGRSFISIQMGSSSKLDSFPSSIHLLPDFPPFQAYILYNPRSMIKYCNITINMIIDIFVICQYFFHLYFHILPLRYFPAKEFYLKFISAGATLHFKWLLHCKEPHCVGKGVTYLKYSFNLINDLQNLTPFSFLRREKFISTGFVIFGYFLLAPTGALIVIVVYYTTTAATFWDFEHFCQYI